MCISALPSSLVFLWPFSSVSIIEPQKPASPRQPETRVLCPSFSGIQLSAGATPSPVSPPPVCPALWAHRVGWTRGFLVTLCPCVCMVLSPPATSQLLGSWELRSIWTLAREATGAEWGHCARGSRLLHILTHNPFLFPLQGSFRGRAEAVVVLDEGGGSSWLLTWRVGRCGFLGTLSLTSSVLCWWSGPGGSEQCPSDARHSLLLPMSVCCWRSL